MSLLKKQTFKSVADRSAGFFYYPKLMGLLLVLTLALLVTKVYFSNQLAVLGAKVSFTNSQLADLTAEKFNLENELSAKSSLSYIDAKAQEMGLVKITKVEVLKGQPNVAFNNR